LFFFSSFFSPITPNWHPLPPGFGDLFPVSPMVKLRLDSHRAPPPHSFWTMDIPHAVAPPGWPPHASCFFFYRSGPWFFLAHPKLSAGNFSAATFGFFSCQPGPCFPFADFFRARFSLIHTCRNTFFHHGRCLLCRLPFVLRRGHLFVRVVFSCSIVPPYFLFSCQSLFWHPAAPPPP